MYCVCAGRQSAAWPTLWLPVHATAGPGLLPAVRHKPAPPRQDSVDSSPYVLPGVCVCHICDVIHHTELSLLLIV